MRALILASILFPLAAASAPAQFANVQFFGAGCSFLSQPLTIGVQGMPRIGTTFTFTYSGPNLNSQTIIQPALAIGLGATNQPIPDSILPQQPFGCSAWIVPDVINLMPVGTPGLFVDHIDMAVPNDPSLTGLLFTAQWLAIVVQCGIVAPCTLEALPTSDAAIMTVGI